jgi:hypothetical protein
LSIFLPACSRKSERGGNQVVIVCVKDSVWIYVGTSDEKVEIFKLDSQSLITIGQ